MNFDAQSLRERCENAGQGHLFRFWDELSEAGRERLAREISELDLDLVGELGAHLADADAAAGAPPQLRPPQLFPLQRDGAQVASAADAAERGAQLLADGRVGYVLVAGGQGSRLGFDGPKGIFPVGPVADTTLFEWHARRLLAARERHGAPIAWYVMTSAANDAETRRFFEEKSYFGLVPGDVRFFVQAMLPALDPDGRILMSSKEQLFLAPNGHGGTLSALADSGCLADASSRGIDFLSYFQVDNPLVRPADPLFLGLHERAGASMSTKVVAKRGAGEKVGVLGLIDGCLGCIEYSDIASALREATDDEGKLLFRAGNIAVHVIDRAFVEQLTAKGLKLPWHIACKQISALDADGQVTSQKGFKFETFIFDALGFAENSVTLEVDRALEFSPVKNATGEDSADSARKALGGLFAGWVQAAGGELPTMREDMVPIEVDPRVAETEADFKLRAPGPPERIADGLLYR
ncbi:MAG: UDP-N-acetylglucosamine/UDP-N-acetylgalactosamine diphosphorylase [Chlamydiales bacterium]|jgi:UDP-N-acetylglucosamine/UDP-N-acetylgalactosamine diphosphorylase